MSAPSTSSPPSQFISVAEAARRLAVSADTLYRLIHVGRLPARRIGRQWRVPVSALAEAER